MLYPIDDLSQYLNTERIESITFDPNHPGKDYFKVVMFSGEFFFVKCEVATELAKNG